MAFHGWKRTRVRLENGDEVDGIAPLIVSASRATDIPAFYAPWFIERLNAGYVRWVNPFNPKQLQFVSLLDTRMVVFWSKNPRPLLPYLPDIDAKGIGYYVQFTLNDYEAEGLEPHVPKLSERLETFMMLSDLIGPRRVVWRFDPLIITESVTVDVLLDRIGRLAGILRGYTEKLVFSFADLDRYRKLRKNPALERIKAREFTDEEMIGFAQGLLSINRQWGFTLASCAEDIGLEGITHNRCIDDLLMFEISGENADLRSLFGFNPARSGQPSSWAYIRDRGQRKACGCIVSKDIGMYDTCDHLCLYCYANHVRKQALLH
jgi:hypothetical protein